MTFRNTQILDQINREQDLKVRMQDIEQLYLNISQYQFKDDFNISMFSYMAYQLEWQIKNYEAIANKEVGEVIKSEPGIKFFKGVDSNGK